MGIISTEDSPESLYQKIKDHPGIGGIDLVKEVTSSEIFDWDEPLWQWPQREKPAHQGPFIVVYNFGVKLNILRNLVNAGFKVKVVPATTAAEEVLEMSPDAVLLSNGPGNPETVTYGIEAARKLFGKVPVFGICLGHQIIGLALGGRTYKLKFGHHGGNHPVMDLETEKVEITSQNHNYCVDIKSLKGQVILTHRNLYDATEEGLRHKDLPIFSVQYHPEAGPGPNDSRYLFKRFRDIVENKIDWWK